MKNSVQNWFNVRGAYVRMSDGELMKINSAVEFCDYAGGTIDDMITENEYNDLQNFLLK